MNVFVLFLFLLPLPENEIKLQFNISQQYGVIEKSDSFRLIGCYNTLTTVRSQEISLVPNRKYLLHFKYMIPAGYTDGTLFECRIQRYQSTQHFFHYIDSSKINLPDTQCYWKDFYKVIKSDKENLIVAFDFHLEYEGYFEGDLLVKEASLKLIGRKFVHDP